jgi:hypothetical protein
MEKGTAEGDRSSPRKTSAHGINNGERRPVANAAGRRRQAPSFLKKRSKKLLSPGSWFAGLRFFSKENCFLP